jgi:hypothetical protein
MGASPFRCSDDKTLARAFRSAGPAARPYPSFPMNPWQGRAAGQAVRWTPVAMQTSRGARTIRSMKRRCARAPSPPRFQLVRPSDPCHPLLVHTEAMRFECVRFHRAYAWRPSWRKNIALLRPGLDGPGNAEHPPLPRHPTHPPSTGDRRMPELVFTQLRVSR